MPRGRPAGTVNGEKLSATERRLKRIAERQETMASKEIEEPDEVFEKAAKNAAQDARQIATDVRDWMYGEIEHEDLIARVSVHYRELSNSLQRLSHAHKLLIGK